MAYKNSSGYLSRGRGHHLDLAAERGQSSTAVVTDFRKRSLLLLVRHFATPFPDPEKYPRRAKLAPAMALVNG